ncbi:MAG TPA: hypothetical protein VIM96_10205 [Pseudomonadales bacterium]
MTIETPSRETLLTLVNRSPAAVAVHDRAAWIAIFARYNVVEDPVGSAAHVSGVFDARSGRRGSGPLERFFDTFIAPNTIQFQVERDVVCAHDVVRDLTIEITMAEGVTVRVPMHLLYECQLEGAEWKIVRLAAHWELMPMIRQVMECGRAAWPVLLQLGWRMFRIQGMGGMLGFSRGFLGIGMKGKDTVHRFVDAVNTAQPVRVFDLFAARNRGIRCPVGEASVSPDQFVNALGGMQMRVEKLLVAGYTVSASITMEQSGERHQGVAFFEFDRREKRLERVDIYWDREGSVHVG